jgi:hypothetical protein
LVAAATACALIAGGTIAAGSSAGAASTGQPSFHLDRVSCVSSTFCMAVGTRGHRMNGVDNSSKTLIERWNGTKWLVVASPNGPAGTSTALNDVSCTGPAFCIAVGITGAPASGLNGLADATTLTMKWNGSKWSTLVGAIPTNVQYAFLNGVSCANPTSCVAVGQEYTPDGRGPTLMERWNGKTWSMLNAPTPPGNNPVVLSSVSCPTTRSCYAAGALHFGSAGQPAELLLHWNGTSFSFAYPGTNTEVGSLGGISCFTPANCTAVGSSGTVYPSYGPIETVVEHWNGTKWSRLTSPNPDPEQDYLSGISCFSTTQCTAVGHVIPGPGYGTLAERGNGPAWSQVTSANAAPPAESALAGVSCRSATYCIAVGHTALQGGTVAEHFNTLAERWNGKKWTIVAGPKPSAS